MAPSAIPPARRRNPHRVDPRVGTRVGAFVKGAELGPVARVLAASRDLILRRWLEAARLQPFHAAQPDGAVADHIPDLFDALVAFLEETAPRGVDPGAPLDDDAVRTAARAHARERFRQGLGAADVLTEFRLLRQEIGRALREHAEGSGDVLAAELLVHDALDGASTLALAALDAQEAEHGRVAAQLAAIVDSSFDAIIGKTLEGVITSWNAAAERLYGYAADEVVGRPIGLIIPPDRADELRAILARVRQGERVEPYETERVRKDGTRVAVSVTVSPVRNASGAVVGASAIARDIGERKRADARAAFLVDVGAALAASLDLDATLAAAARLAVPRVADWCNVYAVGEDGTVRRVAAAHADPAKDALIREIAQRYPLSPDPSHPVRQALATGQTVVSRGDAAQAQRYAIDADHSRLLDELRITSAVVVPLGEELARRDGLAIESARLYRAAQRALHDREELLAAVAHDLKSPLTSIKGNAQLLRQRVLSGRGEPQRLVDRADAISASVDAMAAQIGELLDAARLRAGRPLDLVRRPTDLVALVRRVAARVETIDADHALVVEASTPELVGDWDGFRLERVVGNLLSNAFKYSPEGTPVTLGVGPEEQNGTVWARLAVRDRGIGIPAADLPKVFERYHRGSNVGRTEGDGLGLAGARQVVEQHGGTIEVASTEGAGSTFTVRLPVAPEDRGAP